MRRKILAAALAVALWPALTGCGISELLGGRPEPVQKDEVIWARPGTPGRVIDDHELDLLVPNPKADPEAPDHEPKAPRYLRAKGNPQGMVLIDEATFELYRDTYLKATEGQAGGEGEAKQP